MAHYQFTLMIFEDNIEMAHRNQILTVILVTLATTLVSVEAFAIDQPAIRRAGFSETTIPQVKGRLPIGRKDNLGKAPTAKSLPKANASDSTQNRAVSCGPENAQSDICRKMIQHR